MKRKLSPFVAGEAVATERLKAFSWRVACYKEFGWVAGEAVTTERLKRENIRIWRKIAGALQERLSRLSD